MAALALMLQGTGSDVGKSMLVAGLCRVLTRRGMRVLPFKPQNMSNNAAVAADGGEIGRAQWLQALACGAEPSVHMNPVLLKPQSDRTSQIIVQGRVHATAEAATYQQKKAELLSFVLDSYYRLAQACDIVIVEGAGSPAEVNLRAGDIANMGFAEAVDCPVLLVGDIDRGGVIASLVGTHNVLPPQEQARIRGFIINKFRGDMRLFARGAAEVSERTGWPCLGMVPFSHAARQLPQEDAVVLEKLRGEGHSEDIRICVPMLPRIANFDDLDPLRMEPDVSLTMVAAGSPIPACDLILIPGSKSTVADLAFMREQGWDIDIIAHARQGGFVLGLCGGYQMLGAQLLDPAGVESTQTSVLGLGLLNITTRFAQQKSVRNWVGSTAQNNIPVSGYEIHMGQSQGEDCKRPLFVASGKPEGAQSISGRIMGSYIHGMFTSDAFRHAFLSRIRLREASALAYHAQMEELLDSWADLLEQQLDIDALLKLAAPITLPAAAQTSRKPARKA